ncbi:MAG: glycosyltransferase [Chlamydiae bacterium]|nr:glycosyltransferase [Chlamydiota bacterium]
MRGFFFFLALIVLVFFAGFSAARFHVMDRFPFFSTQKTQETGFLPTLHPQESLPFCVVIVGKNNGAYLEKSLLSALTQSYDNFRVIYLDDGSEDGSFSLAEEIAEKTLGKIQLLRNEKTVGVFPSLGKIADFFKEGEIVVLLDGNNWLSHEWVLERLNQYYADPDLWMTIGKTLAFPSYESLETPFLSFYADLIKENDSFEELSPMTKEHSQNLPDVLSIHPMETS